MAKASGTIDLRSQKAAHDDAAKTASNYLTTISGVDGITVHNLNDTSNFAALNSDGMQVYKSGTSVAEFGENVRIGEADGTRFEMSPSAITLFNSSSIQALSVSSSSATISGEIGTSVGPYKIDYATGTSGTKSVTCSNVVVSSNLAHVDAYCVFEKTSTKLRFYGTSTQTKTIGNVSYSASWNQSTKVFSVTITGNTTSAAKFYLERYYETSNTYAPTLVFGKLLSTASVGAYSAGFGDSITPQGNYSFATGYHTSAIGTCSFAEGQYTLADASFTHAEGNYTEATASYAHAEGNYSVASNFSAHAEGDHCTASGENAHAQGGHTTASGKQSFATGYQTVAQRLAQTAIGYYNVLDTTGSSTEEQGKYIFIIGKGTGESARSNAFTVDWSGNAEIAGAIKNMSGTTLLSNTGNAVSATKATQDGSGNTITSTYAKLSGATFTGNVTSTAFIPSDHTPPAGAIGENKKVEPSAVTCTTGKYYNIGSVTLEPGVWVVTMAANFASASTANGIRRMYLTTAAPSGWNNTTTGPAQLSIVSYDQRAAIANQVVVTHATAVFNPGSSITAYLVGYHSQGANLAVTGRIYAVRIA